MANEIPASLSNKDPKARTSELILAQVSSQKRMETLRKAIIKEFSSDRLWLFVSKNLSDNRYKISVSNYSAGSLEDEIATRVKKFVKEFLDKETDLNPDPTPETIESAPSETPVPITELS